MTTLPKLQESFCGVNLKTGTYVILSFTIAITFFGLVIITANRVGNDQNESNLDFQYIFNMVVSILLFLVAPIALYGTYRERSAFLMPYLFVKAIGIILFIGNIVFEFFTLFGEHPVNFFFLVFLLVSLALPIYSFLVVFSYYSALKEQREEIH